ncbi:DUF3992 domain-containing protein [Lysinibacillus sp. CD3-6]|uniref:DUF3992 domain-containing protein n=1 Tax=Lysinibacillus sp. CD3-6 TaxID=2892541 RepID=UPI0011757F10|nr:S-Ena type endospore appendage [Lysinibacillus sp. CD3-6]UED81522.1 DUF3992 domain-containing protein [Lysinibacillus sp. CD3-6]
MQNEKPSVHCVKVSKIYDWVNNSTVIKLREMIQLEQKKFDDYICCDFSVPSGQLERTILWTTYGINQIGGSICINFKSGYGNILSVFVNGEKQAEVNEGSSFSATFTHLDSIEVQCIGNTPNCHGEFKIMFHYHPGNDYKLNSPRDIKQTICYVSDCHGNPISSDSGSSITCKELTCSDNRECVHVTDERGETILLHIVDFLVEGFICVQFMNNQGEICSKCIFPFSEVETVALCAPPGTEINFKVIDVNCRTHIIPSSSFHNKTNCIELVIMLSICQSIYSFNKVIIELIAALCQPRKCTDCHLEVHESVP